MTKSLIVRCDQCVGEFIPWLKHKPSAGGGAERFFHCPHCRHRYVVAHISPAGVHVLDQIRRVERTLQRQPRNTELKEQLVELRQRLQPEVTAA